MFCCSITVCCIFTYLLNYRRVWEGTAAVLGLSYPPPGDLRMASPITPVESNDFIPHVGGGPPGVSDPPLCLSGLTFTWLLLVFILTFVFFLFVVHLSSCSSTPGFSFLYLPVTWGIVGAPRLWSPVLVRRNMFPVGYVPYLKVHPITILCIQTYSIHLGKLKPLISLLPND